MFSSGSFHSGSPPSSPRESLGEQLLTRLLFLATTLFSVSPAPSAPPRGLTLFLEPRSVLGLCTPSEKGVWSRSKSGVERSPPGTSHVPVQIFQAQTERQRQRRGRGDPRGPWGPWERAGQWRQHWAAPGQGGRGPRSQGRGWLWWLVSPPLCARLPGHWGPS